MFSPKPFSHIPELDTSSSTYPSQTQSNPNATSRPKKLPRHGTFLKIRFIVCSQTSLASSYSPAKGRNTDGQGARCASRRVSRTGSTAGFRTLHGKGGRPRMSEHSTVPEKRDSFHGRQRRSRQDQRHDRSGRMVPRKPDSGEAAGSGYGEQSARISDALLSAMTRPR